MTKMSIARIWSMARHLLRQKFATRSVLLLLSVYLLSHGYICWERWHGYEQQLQLRQEHQQRDRASWEGNPDKHPHRMAHFGAFAFRQQHPLSIMDAGLESYMGNVIFLEAHKQNTANFSEASLSTGLVRFGELHSGMLLYLILPLFIFFIGHDAVSRERERRTLRLMYLQGADMREVVLGKSLGLWLGSALFFAPVLLASLFAGVLLGDSGAQYETLARLGVLSCAYVVFYAVLSLGTVLVSAWSRSSTHALLTLLGAWLMLFVVVPRCLQAIGGAVHPSPSKLAFRLAIDREVAAGGDSHNPNDPHFAALKDSVLRVYGVSDVRDLPFNYGGYVMSHGEARTANIYAAHQRQLTDTYRRQGALSRWFVWLDPYLAMRSLSMSLSGTDFETYNGFLLQAEQYRYTLAQYMNKLQMEHVSSHATGSSEGRAHAIDRSLFAELPPFDYEYMSLGQVLGHEWAAAVALLVLLSGLLTLALGAGHRIRIL